MRTALVIIAAAVVAFLIDFAVAKAALRLTGVPNDFPPFTPLPILSGVAGGFLLACMAYFAIRAGFARPEPVFLFTVVISLSLSFALPLRLSFTKSRRFMGVTPGAQISLVLMHSVVAAAATVALTRANR